MQFRDETKEYEINFKFVRNMKINPVPVFEISMTKPVTASAGFDILDIKTQQGYTGISVSKFSDIAKAVKSKKDVLIVVAPEAISFVKKTHAAELEKLKKEAQKDPERWFWAIGGDTHKLYLTPDSETGTTYREDLKKVETTLEKNINWFKNPLRDKSAKIDRHTGLYTETGWFEVSHEDVMRIYSEILAAKDAKKAEAGDKKKAIFKKAKETGEKQVIETYTDECNDPDESCDVDIITVYAMPDGSTTETRNHTW
jgi:hypothetical protein